MIVLEPEFLVDPQDFLGNACRAQKIIGRYQGFQLEQLAAYAVAHEDDEFAHIEVAALLHMSDGAAQARLKFARALIERLPQTSAALKQGEIEEYKAKLIADAVAPLSDEHALAVEARVLGEAGGQTSPSCGTGWPKPSCPLTRRALKSAARNGSGSVG